MLVVRSTLNRRPCARSSASTPGSSFSARPAPACGLTIRHTGPSIRAVRLAEHEVAERVGDQRRSRLGGVGPLARRRAGEDQGGIQAGAPGARDVDVEAVADAERAPVPEAV